MAADIYPGFRGVLVPTNATAPTAAYRMPEIIVTAVNGPRITVALPDGSQIETDRANIRRTRPDSNPDRHPDRHPDTRRTPVRPRPDMPDGYEAQPLF